jgi:hypothetical protein
MTQGGGGGGTTFTGATTFLIVVTFAVLFEPVVLVEAQTTTDPLLIIEPTLTEPLDAVEVQAALAGFGAKPIGNKSRITARNFFMGKT